ncbi:TPA: septum formation protein Maf, partial [Legionella pneumophila]
FKEVQGSEDTILGLPLMPLVNALVNLKVVGI